MLENYIPGKLDKLGIGYQALQKIAPSIIYCAITGKSVYSGTGSTKQQRQKVISPPPALPSIAHKPESTNCKIQPFWGFLGCLPLLEMQFSPSP